VTDYGYKIMSPSEHYAAASGLLTRGLDAVTRLHAPDSVPVDVLDHVIARAHVHAVLASIPQGQYDAGGQPSSPPNRTHAWRSARSATTVPPARTAYSGALRLLQRGYADAAGLRPLRHRLLVAASLARQSLRPDGLRRTPRCSGLLCVVRATPG
jgi:hypothetical protein